MGIFGEMGSGGVSFTSTPRGDPPVNPRRGILEKRGFGSPPGTPVWLPGQGPPGPLDPPGAPGEPRGAAARG